MTLKFPLHHYDDAGRLKPPLMLYLFLLFLCRGLLLLIISLSFREDSSRMMSLFFPNKWDFYYSLIPAVPALLILALFSQRTKLWKNDRHGLFKWIPTFFVMALLADIAVQVSILSRIGFQFSFTHGLSILIAIIALVYFKQSRHMQDLPLDWARSD